MSFAHRWFVFPLVVMLFGFFLRAYHWSAYGFSFDQVQIVENAMKITQGDVTLIGPRTGPASMFTGPLMYYLMAGAVTIAPVGGAVVGTALLVSLCTGLVLYLISRRYWSFRWSMMLLFLWAVSPLIVTVDRTLWNPNLTLISAVCCLFPLLNVLKTNKARWFDYGLIFIGGFLGYQAHFSGFLLPPLIAVTSLAGLTYGWTFLRKSVATTAAASLGLAVSLLPTLLFDYRNNWLNLRGFTAVFTSASPSTTTDRLLEAGRTLLTAFSNFGRIIIPSEELLLTAVGGLILTLGVAWFMWKQREQSWSRPMIGCLSWVSLVVVIFAFYQGNKPEYYFMIMTPAFLVMVSYLAEAWLTKRSQLLLAAGTMAILSGVFITQKYHKGNGVNLGNSLAVVAFVNNQVASTGVKGIVYDLPEVDTVGLKFLLKETPLQPEGVILHLLYSVDSGSLVTKKYDDLAVWLDPRTDPNLSYVTRPDYVLSYPQDWSLYQDLSEAATAHGQETFVIADSQLKGSLRIIKRSANVPFFEEQLKQLNDKDFAGFGYPQGEFIVMYQPKNLLETRSESEKILNSFVLVQ